MTISKAIATLIVPVARFATPPLAFAGGSSSCHFHGSTPAPEKTVLECAAKRLDTLASKSKIDPLWKGKTHDSIEVVEAAKSKEWKVTYSDPQAKDAAKTKLYLYFAHSGNFLAANHTGK